MNNLYTTTQQILAAFTPAQQLTILRLICTEHPAKLISAMLELDLETHLQNTRQALQHTETSVLE